jgi:LPS-assembly lipoprotein
MSSPDLKTVPRLAALGLAVLMAGCTDVRPLYAPMATSAGPVAILPHIAIDPATERVPQVVRNELIFAFTGGEEPDKPLYRLVLRQNSGTVPVGSEKYQRLPAATVVQIDVGFQLIEIGSNRILYQGTSFATASYNFSSQRFANTRAKLDAQDRAAQVVAGDIRTKIAAWVATHPLT